MKRSIFLTALALLISAGITAQDTGQTHKRDQLRIHNQTGSGDQIRKRDQIRLHDPSQKMSRTGTQNAQMRNQGASQARRKQSNASLRNSAMNHNMRTSGMSGAGRR